MNTQREIPDQKAQGLPQRAGPIDSRELFQNRDELLIKHAGQEYRLRITRQNKLILTK